MSAAPAVGIVLVSHSAELAQGAAHLAAQVSGGTVTIIAAGGTDEGDLGTSAAKVTRGLRLADSGAGVVVLPDLGSAVLTVRAVLEVMGLGATSGQHVTVSAAGPDAPEAVAALITILGEATKGGG